MSKKRNKHQTNRNCHVARQTNTYWLLVRILNYWWSRRSQWLEISSRLWCALLDLVEAWCEEHGCEINMLLSQIHVWETFNVILLRIYHWKILFKLSWNSQLWLCLIYSHYVFKRRIWGRRRRRRSITWN